jgi:hypothetical protein
MCEAMRGGMSYVCAACRRYWEGRLRGTGDRCTAQDGCGSPIAGDDFHEYEGPITSFDRWCFVCAAAADFAVKPVGKGRAIGVCRTHLKFMEDLVPRDRDTLGSVVRATGESLVLPRGQKFSKFLEELEDA